MPAGPRGPLPALDGLRGLAIGGVLACHLLNAWPGDGAWERRAVAALGLGWTGVDLFFVLSGFLITGGLVDTLGQRGWWRGFLVRRALRIFPLYYLALAAFAAAGPALGLVDPWTFGRWGWWYWSYLGNWAYAARQVIPALSHFWSLAVEEQFYLAWPLVVLLARGRALAAASAALVCAGPALRWLIVDSGLPVGSAYRLTPGRVDALAMGALVAVLARAAGGAGLLRRAWLPAAAAGAAGFAALGLPHGFDMHARPLEIWSHLWLALAFGGLVAGAVATAGADHPLRRALSAGPLRALGRYSYGLYVVHYLVHVGALGALRARPWGAALLASRTGYAAYAAAALAASLLLAWGSFHLVEKRFLALKDRLAPRRAAA
ncbi:acyltransferase family protein [Anaeromyxobacter dehalogenans]|uniref:Acyltransferase 3 n=1 Tax=Anaeromyxobacter dehalogenans (strain 2CP-C) TaxID=290397 RepID=Q2IJK8_ANADE|nr:acyltransferase [Anaeromyxobacter dehalogenans]ABC81839.1 Acyltransferase 3 [Anaeromyxobacter dehalogenans 2CP-C]